MSSRRPPQQPTPSAPSIPTRRAQVWMRSAARLTLPTLFRLEHVGREHLPPSGPAVIVPNHPTYLDPWFVAYGTRRWITWMAWEDAFGWPLVGTVIRSMGAFPVNLERPTPSTLRAALRVLEQGRLLGIFFEGGRTQAPGYDVDAPRPGAVRIALKAAVPIVPVSVAGARRAWPRERRLPRPGKVRVVFHPAILPHDIRGGSPREREAHLNQTLLHAIRSALPADGRHRTWQGA